MTATHEMSVRGPIPREDVAATFAAVLATPSTIGKTFVVVERETPLEDARASL